MYISPLDWVLVGYLALQEVNALVTSMSKPKHDDGAYAFWYKFLHASTNNLDIWYSQKFHMPFPPLAEDQPDASPKSPTK